MNTFFATVLALSSAANAPAGIAPASSVSPLSPIYACAEKTDPTQRLACFDATVAAVKAAEARSDIVTLDRPRVAAVRREAFGFRMPSLPRFGFGSGAAVANAGGAPNATASRSRDDLDDEQTFAVARVSSAGNRVTLYLDNGNVWQFTEAGELNAPRQTPFNVRIRAAAMGSFLLSVEGRNKGYRVRRVE